MYVTISRKFAWIRTTVQTLCTDLGNGDIKCNKTANKNETNKTKKMLTHSNCENTFCLPKCKRHYWHIYKSEKQTHE